MKTSFHSVLAPDIESFIDLKRSLGYSIIARNISCIVLMYTGRTEMVLLMLLRWKHYPDG